LITWAAKSIHKSINQPALPHLIIVMNATDPNIDDKQWDIETATDTLLGVYAESIHQVAKLQEFLLEVKQRSTKEIKTTRDILEYYYSSVAVIRIPSKGRYMQIDNQIGKLYDAINFRCVQSYARKYDIRMLLNSERLPQYVTAAYALFSKEIDQPFDFLKEARRYTPRPRDFGGHILNLVLSIYNLHEGQKIDVEHLIRRLSRPIASCIILATMRDNLPGAYSHQLKETYLQPLQKAFLEFCNSWLQCSFEKDGYKCCNARNSHDKGHQGPDGKILARGSHQATFIAAKLFPEWIKEIDEHINSLDDNMRQSNIRDANTTYRQHCQVMVDYFRSSTISATQVKHSLTCLCCIRKLPEYALPCKHILCKSCMQAAGQNQGRGVFEFDCCPLHPDEMKWSPYRIRIKPSEAGVRVMCLDGGGIRGVVELLILQAIEKELGSNIRIQNFFDLIVGTSTGGIIALGLGVKGWTVSDCISRFRDLCNDAFTARGPKAFRPLTFLGKSFYKTTPLENALKTAFGVSDTLYGQAKSKDLLDIRVAVTSTDAIRKRPVILSNYNTEGDRDNLPYDFIRTHDPDREVKVWEAARATSAAPPYFKPFVRQETGDAYTDGAIHHNCPVSIADDERRLLWEDVSHWAPDIVLSLGTGLGTKDSTKHPSSVSQPQKDLDRLRKWIDTHKGGLRLIWWAAQAIVENQLDCEKAWRHHCSKAIPLGPKSRIEDVRRNIRLNVLFSGPRPSLDAFKTLDTTESFVQAYLQETPAIKDEIHEVADRLIASCFYFERSGQGQKVGNIGKPFVYRCKGHICCRFIEGSDDLKGLGRILRSRIQGRTFVPHFCLQENYGSSDENTVLVSISRDQIRNMCESGTFEPLNLTIDAADKSSTTRLSLCLQEHDYRVGEGYSSNKTPESGVEPLLSISGFPRNLWAAKGSRISASFAKDMNSDAEGEATQENSPVNDSTVPRIFIDHGEDGEDDPKAQESRPNFVSRAWSWAASSRTSSPRRRSSPSRESVA
jgi:predicted acylesterase/phospholipase RssA